MCTNIFLYKDTGPNFKVSHFSKTLDADMRGTQAKLIGHVYIYGKELISFTKHSSKSIRKIPTT